MNCCLLYLKLQSVRCEKVLGRAGKREDKQLALLTRTTRAHGPPVFIVLFFKSFDAHIEQLLDKFVCGFILQFFYLCYYHLFFIIFQRLGVLA